MFLCVQPHDLKSFQNLYSHKVNSPLNFLQQRDLQSFSRCTTTRFPTFFLLYSIQPWDLQFFKIFTAIRSILFSTLFTLFSNKIFNPFHNIQPRDLLPCLQSSDTRFTTFFYFTQPRILQPSYPQGYPVVTL